MLPWLFQISPVSWSKTKQISYGYCHYQVDKEYVEMLNFMLKFEKDNQGLISIYYNDKNSFFNVERDRMVSLFFPKIYFLLKWFWNCWPESFCIPFDRAIK